MFLSYTCIGFGTYFNLLVRIGTVRVPKHVNGWCFRGIYNGSLWEEDLQLLLVLLVRSSCRD